MLWNKVLWLDVESHVYIIAEKSTSPTTVKVVNDIGTWIFLN